MTALRALADPGDRAEQIRRIVDQAPPLTDGQRARLRPLLAGGLPARIRQAQAAPYAA